MTCTSGKSTLVFCLKIDVQFAEGVARFVVDDCMLRLFGILQNIIMFFLLIYGTVLYTARGTDINTLSREYIEKRREAILQLRKLAEELEKHEHNGRIAHVTGLCLSIVGGVITVGCLIAIPFTGGLSTIGAGVAEGIGLGGGGTSLGTAIVNKCLEKGILKRVQSSINEDKRLKKDFLDTIPDILGRPDTYLKGGNGIVGAAKLITKIIDCADDAMKGLGTAARVSKVLGYIGAGITVAIMPLDIYDLIKTSIDIHKKTVSETASDIRKIASELEDSLPTLYELLDD